MTRTLVGGVPFRDGICIGVSRFFTERTKIGVSQIGLWLICSLWCARRCASIGGYMMEVEYEPYYRVYSGGLQLASNTIYEVTHYTICLQYL